MSRWKVECGFWWVAMQVDEQGREIPGTAKRFPTYAEAMVYADKRARTIEVTLPRLGDDAIQILSREGFIPYKPAYAEEIAQAMLAIAHKREQA